MLRCVVAYWHIAAFAALQRQGRKRSKGDKRESTRPIGVLPPFDFDFILSQKFFRQFNTLPIAELLKGPDDNGIGHSLLPMAN